MHKLRYALVVALLASCTLSHAQAFVWRDHDGKAVPDNDHQKAKDGFGALVLLTDDEKVFDNWQKPDEPKIKTLTVAERGVPIHVVVIFAGPGSDADGDANVTYTAKVLAPDGSVYGEFEDLEALKGSPAPPSSPLQMAPVAMAVRIEPQDPAGTYTVEIAITDNVRKVKLTLKETFTVEK